MKFQDSARKPLDIRIAAATLSTGAPSIEHCPNNDEVDPFLFSFTKGLTHKENGLLSNPKDFCDFKAGTRDHNPSTFAKTKPHRAGFHPANLPNLDPMNIAEERARYRRWESPTAGHAYVGEGPDPHAVTMPPAPEVGSAEFAAEMAEVYEMALGRDWCVAALMATKLVDELKTQDGTAQLEAHKREIGASASEVEKAADRLTKMRWFSGTADHKHSEEIKRRRRHGEPQKAENIFRGLGEDPWDTPFLSQFMVMGSGGKTKDLRKRAKNRASGQIVYGAQRIPQKVRVARPGQDYMTGWHDWLNVQNGMNARDALPDDAVNSEFLPDAYRPIARLRDLATYVHDDQLYQAYLNAALILLDEGFAFDPGIPFHEHAKWLFPFETAKDGDTNQTPFALFGGPHLLTLVTEVSSRALKAVRLQKFSVHRRLRPEAAGALFHTVCSGYKPHGKSYGDNGDSDEITARQMLKDRIEAYTRPHDKDADASEGELHEILERVKEHNANQGKNHSKGQNGTEIAGSWLLPMAFPEGSPMHPSYGAGHATVAGACVTLLKAFFAMRDKSGDPVLLVEKGGPALVPSGGIAPDDIDIKLLSVNIPKGLTLEGELNKLMWNISNARNIAGVHYYTDYVESALLGEAITIGILREQMLSYHENEQVEMTVPLLVKRTLPASLLTGQTDIGPNDDVSAVKISNEGTLLRV